MRLRIISDKRTEGVEYKGIRDSQKLKCFLMSDLMTAFAYRVLSVDYHQNDGKKISWDECLRTIVTVSRRFSFDYYGGNSGTVADQMTKRINDMVSRFEGKDASLNTTPATMVTKEQFEMCRGVYTTTGSEIVPSVRLLPPMNTDLSTKLTRSDTMSSHVPLSKIKEWIIGSILTPSRIEPNLQCIMWSQYELENRLTSDMNGINEERRLQLVRTYIALKCILRSDFQIVGDEYELQFSTESFMDLLPPLPKAPPLRNPVIVCIGDKDTHVYNRLKDSEIFRDGTIIETHDNELDICIGLFKARLSKNFEKITLIFVIPEDNPPGILNRIERSVKFTGLNLDAQIFVFTGQHGSTDISDEKKYTIHCDRNCVCNILEDMSRTGLLLNDELMLPILKNVYADILQIGYPRIKIGSGRESDFRDMIDYLFDCVYTVEPPTSIEYRELVISIRDNLIKMKHELKMPRVQ